MKLKTCIITLSSMILTIIYFCYNITLGYDSSQYVWLSEMISGNIDFSNWAPVRSFIFPLGIYVSNTLFGKSRYGLLIATFVFYVIMLVTVYLMYKDIVGKNEKNKWIKILIIFAIVILVALNPIIFGFYHVILTEFASITIAILAAYLSWRWIGLDFTENKLKYSIYTGIFIFLTICSWHLKQTYILTLIVPLVIAAIISIIEKCNWKNILQRAIVILLCIISLFISIKCWNNLLEKRNVKINDKTTSNGLLGNSLMEGISKYRKDINPESYKRENIVKDTRISEEDKQKILDIIDKKSNEYKSFILLDKGTFIEPEGNRKVIYLKDENISVGEGLKFVADTFFSEPATVINSYISNYLAIIDVFKVRVNIDYGNYYYIEKSFDLGQDLEINFLAYNIYRNMTNALDLPEFYSKYAQEYISNNQYIEPVNNYMVSMTLPAKVLFKVIMLLLPLLWLIKLISYFIFRKKYEQKFITNNHLIFILYSYALAQMTMYSVLGALMDRYAVAAYTTTLVGFIFDVYLNIIRRKKYKKAIENKEEKRKDNKIINEEYAKQVKVVKESIEKNIVEKKQIEEKEKNNEKNSKQDKPNNK